MKPIFASLSASLSELKKNPAALLEAAEGSAVAILNHNKPAAYLIPAEAFEALMEQLEDYQLGIIVRRRQKEKSQAVEVAIDEL